MTACAALSKPTRRVLPPMVGLWRKRSDHHYLARPAIPFTALPRPLSPNPVNAGDFVGRGRNNLRRVSHLFAIIRVICWGGYWGGWQHGPSIVYQREALLR